MDDLSQFEMLYQTLTESKNSKKPINKTKTTKGLKRKNHKKQ